MPSNICFTMREKAALLAGWASNKIPEHKLLGQLMCGIIHLIGGLSIAGQNMVEQSRSLSGLIE